MFDEAIIDKNINTLLGLNFLDIDKKFTDKEKEMMIKYFCFFSENFIVNNRININLIIKLIYMSLVLNNINLYNDILYIINKTTLIHEEGN